MATFTLLQMLQMLYGVSSLLYICSEESGCRLPYFTRGRLSRGKRPDTNWPTPLKTPVVRGTLMCSIVTARADDPLVVPLGKPGEAKHASPAHRHRTARTILVHHCQQPPAFLQRRTLALHKFAGFSLDPGFGFDECNLFHWLTHGHLCVGSFFLVVSFSRRGQRALERPRPRLAQEGMRTEPNRDAGMRPYAARWPSEACSDGRDADALDLFDAPFSTVGQTEEEDKHKANDIKERRSISGCLVPGQRNRS